MSNDIYPSTTLPPVQPIRFMLSDGRHFESVLRPLPDQSGEHIGSVKFELSLTGTDFGTPMIYGGGKTMLEAAEASFREVARITTSMGGIQIVEIRHEGREFLDTEDLEAIFGTAIPIAMY